MRLAHERLAAALVARGGAGAAMRDGAWSDWASATFVGARHRLTLRVAAADAFVAGLDEAEFALPGHLVADIVVTARDDDADGALIAIEALTIEAA